MDAPLRHVMSEAAQNPERVMLIFPLVLSYSLSHDGTERFTRLC